MQGWRIFSLVCAALTLQACASMNENECMMSDWQSVGYEDGARGYTADRIGNYRKACAKHGVAPDLQAYQEGRKAGLAEFCDPQNGYNLGARGGSYSGVCPERFEEDFTVAYQAGYRLYELKSDVRNSNNQIRIKRNQLDALKKDMRDKVAQMASSETSSEERLALLVETRDMAKREGELEAQILELERKKATSEERLAQYRSEVATRY